jgi:hypothetical protein
VDMIPENGKLNYQCQDVPLHLSPAGKALQKSKIDNFDRHGNILMNYYTWTLVVAAFVKILNYGSNFFC